MKTLLKIFRSPFGISLVVLLSAAFLRFYRIGSVYSDWDDLHMFALQYTQAPKIQPAPPHGLIARIEAALTVSDPRPLDSPFFGLLVARLQTAPPLPYALYPIFLKESDTLEVKLVTARAMSALLQVLALAAVFFVLRFMAPGVNSAKALPGLIFAAFSANAVLYAHHTSPYSGVFLASSLSCLLVMRYLQGRISTRQVFIFHGMLIYLSYLTLLSLPILFAVSAAEERRKNSSFKALFSSLAWYLVSIVPVVLLFLKPDRGQHGLAAPDSGLPFVQYARVLFEHFLAALSSTVAAISADVRTNIILAASLCGLFLLALASKRRLHPLSWFSLGNLLVWVLLHACGMLVMDQTRHVLAWLPWLAILVTEIMIRTPIKNSAVGAACAVFIPICFANNLRLLNLRVNAFEYSLLEGPRKEMAILMYNETLGPAAYFRDSRTIFDLSQRWFWEDKNGLNRRSDGLLVSQTAPLDEERRNNRLLDAFLRDYEIETIASKPSAITMNYSNYGVSTQPNGFYLYVIRKKAA